MAWWEYLLQFGIAVVLIVIMKIVGEKAQTNDTEYWGDLIKKVEYYEKYSIWDHETCSRQVQCGTDSKGNAIYCTEYYDCSHLDTYPARWEAITVSGWNISITKSDYESLVKKFQAVPQFRDMHREKECGFGDRVVDDGNMYYAEWKGSPETSEFVSKTHTYENKVQCSNSVFNYRPVSEEDIKAFGLYHYPDIRSYKVPTILGGSNLPELSQAEQKLQFLNGDLGPKKQLRVWILIFRNKTLSSAKLQEAYWKNGNKNEFVVTIGLNNLDEVQWCYPFSWTEVQELKISTRNFVVAQKKIDLVALADFLYPELRSKWVRKQFKDFSYLTVEPPLWGLIVAFVLQILFNVFYSIWAVRNEFDA
jgi:hypothetical protein